MRMHVRYLYSTVLPAGPLSTSGKKEAFPGDSLLLNTSSQGYVNAVDVNND